MKDPVVTGLIAVRLPARAAAGRQMTNFAGAFEDGAGRGAASAEVSSGRLRSFPDSDTSLNVSAKCHTVWVGFSEGPCLVSGISRDGFALRAVSVRVDGRNGVSGKAHHAFGDGELGLANYAQGGSALQSAAVVAIALPRFEKGSVARSRSLEGSSQVIWNGCD